LPAAGNHNFARINTVFASDDVFRSVGIDFLGVTLLGLKFFHHKPPKPQIFGPFLDLEIFAQKRFTMGMLQSKTTLNHHRSPESCIVNGQIGVKVSKFLVATGPPQ